MLVTMNALGHPLSVSFRLYHLRLQFPSLVKTNIKLAECQLPILAMGTDPLLSIKAASSESVTLTLVE